MASCYAQLAPEHLRVPVLDGFADKLEAEAESTDDTMLQLVADARGWRCPLKRSAPAADEASG